MGSARWDGGMDDVDEVAAPVPGAHRVIRRLDETAALRGDLVSDGDRQRVSADAEALDEVLWRFAGAEHVAGVRDVARTRDGQSALLPWCADSLDLVLARRAAAERPLATGEIVTLVGSLLRGIIEVAGDEMRGRWWLDDEARPLFVPGEGTSCASASVEVIERLRRDCADRALERVLRRVADAAGDHRVVLRSLDEWERELTELAAPRPIDVSVYAPELVRELPVHRAHLPLDAERMRTAPALGERLSAARARLSEHLGAVRMRVVRSRGDRPERRAEDGARAPRRRMLLVGAAVAGVVLAGGLLWPTGGEDSSATDALVVRTKTDADAAAASAAPHAATSAPPEKGEASAPATESTDDGGTPAPKPVGGSIEAAVAGLLSTIDVCRENEDAECADAVVGGAGGDIVDRLGPRGASRTLSLIEDYGDIAVVRLGRTQERGEQMIVIVRQNDEWLARDVYDVADQPSETG